MKPDDLRIVLECAELAPSVHNTQPWTWLAAEDSLELRADRDRGLPVLDPHGRELTISCGAAIEFAYAAVRGVGFACAIELLPDPDDDDLLARLRIGAPQPIEDSDRDLYEAIPRRYTDRGSYEPASLTADLVGELHHGVDTRGAWLRVLDRDGDRLAVIQALTHAESTEAADPAYRIELASWLRTGSSPDGIPLAALGDPTESDRVSDVPLRDFSGANDHPRPGGYGPPPPVERDTLLLLGTPDESPHAWLAAGRALGWLLLRLTAAGLSSQPLGQAVDVDSTRVRLAAQLGVIGHVQFLLRTGHGHGAPTTGRRHASLV